ncbi:tetraspanin-18-like [Punica granatum]|uniref:Tetraspanin-18-like n=1 Tax=Punica granatum TaxID=22663 RepID=A0A6P8BNZ2_PUNGR|nr:tetraspanin-18-like [Punica granatum]
MRRNCCHISLAFVLKVLNYLQTFVGISIILYSAWMLNQWSHHVPVFPPSAPPPDSSAQLLLNSRSAGAFADRVTPLDFAADMVSGLDVGIGVVLNDFKFPAPWFIYSFMGVGVVLCCVSFIGCIAAEAINGCCLCFYTLLVTVLLLIEAALVAFIAIDRQWEQILPVDPTGELNSLRSFIEKNVAICKWVGIAIVVVQALSLLLSFVLRALVSPRRGEFDYEDDCENTRSRTREPLLNSQLGQTSAGHSDLWSSLVREKYGLNNGDKVLSQNASGSTKNK